MRTTTRASGSTRRRDMESGASTTCLTMRLWRLNSYQARSPGSQARSATILTSQTPDFLKAGTMKKSAARQGKPRAKAGAEERISYLMPAFFQGGAIIYFAPFRHHVGMFPPVKGDAALEKALAKYRGEKGNLRFPLDEPMPYPLIRRVVRARLKALHAKQATAQRR